MKLSIRQRRAGADFDPDLRNFQSSSIKQFGMKGEGVITIQLSSKGTDKGKGRIANDQGTVQVLCGITSPVGEAIN